MRQLRWFLAWAALALAPAAGMAQPLDAAQVRSWAAACANCHGTVGNAQPGIAALGGMKRDEIVGKMLDFKNGRQPASVMHQLAKWYSDEQIAAIAGYFAVQKK